MSYNGLVELDGARIDAQYHLDFAVSLEVVLEEERELGVAIGHHLARAERDVVAQRLHAVAQRHERRVDAAGLAESRARVLGALGALAAGQVDQRQLAHVQVVLVLGVHAGRVAGVVLGRIVGRLDHAYREYGVAARRLGVQVGRGDHAPLLRPMHQIERLLGRLDLDLVHVLDVHAAARVLLQALALLHAFATTVRVGVVCRRR